MCGRVRLTSIYSEITFVFGLLDDLESNLASR